jgi:hypothetical protein
MTDINIAFCRLLLSQITPEIRAAGKRVYKDAWVWTGDGRQWEWHGPETAIWYGRADNAYDARFKGWSSWLDKQGE